MESKSKIVTYKNSHELNTLHDLIAREFNINNKLFSFNLYCSLQSKSKSYYIEIKTDEPCIDCINIYTYSFHNGNLFGQIRDCEFLSTKNIAFELFDSGIMNGKYILKGSLYDDEAKELGKQHIIVEIVTTNDWIINY